MFALSIPRSPGSKQIQLRNMLNQNIINEVDQAILSLKDETFNSKYEVESCLEGIKRSQALEVISYVSKKYPQFLTIFKQQFYSARGSVNIVIKRSCEWASDDPDWSKFDEFYDHDGMTK